MKKKKAISDKPARVPDAVIDKDEKIDYREELSKIDFVISLNFLGSPKRIGASPLNLTEKASAKALNQKKKVKRKKLKGTSKS